ncbi:septum formation inhibitor Maf [Pasteurellaceae bacterium Macca]|nr:septum formation inhibitor Maf [Pasteurellaceae bacterium Macca]
MMSKTLYLASTSPRRWELLQQLGLSVSRIGGEIDETPKVGEDAKSYCQRIAKAKNQAAQAVVFSQQFAPLPLLTADTTVSIDGQILGKPKDKAEAFAMLSQLSGRTHHVYTAVGVSVGEEYFSTVQTSEVTLRSLSEAEIWAYIDTQDPLDKAGAYGIQGIGGSFIQYLSGSFTGVMGLPLYETAELLKRCGITILA